MCDISYAIVHIRALTGCYYRVHREIRFEFETIRQRVYVLCGGKRANKNTYNYACVTIRFENAFVSLIWKVLVCVRVCFILSRHRGTKNL